MNEHQVQSLFTNWCKQNSLFFFSVPNGSHLAGDKKQRLLQVNKLKAEGMRAGTADFIVMLDSKNLFFEFKVGTNKQSKEQKLFEKHIERFNHSDYYVVYSSKDAEDITLRYLEEEN